MTLVACPSCGQPAPQWGLIDGACADCWHAQQDRLDGLLQRPVLAR